MKAKRVVKAQVQPVVRRSGYAVLSSRGYICINDELMPAIFASKRRALSFSLCRRNGKVVDVEIDVYVV